MGQTNMVDGCHLENSILYTMIHLTDIEWHVISLKLGFRYAESRSDAILSFQDHGQEIR